MDKILDLKLRGYVTPDDVPGASDTEKLRNALAMAAGEDIRKVIIDRSMKLEQTVRIPAGMEIRFSEGVKVEAPGTAFVNEVCTEPEKASWSFEDQWIFLYGEKDSCLCGDLKFFHAGNLVIEDMTVNGQVSFEFCREVRMERNTVKTQKETAVTLKRGCNNYIVQYNTFAAAENAIAADASLEEGNYVIGKDTDIHEIIIRDNTLETEAGLFIGASEESGVFNLVYDHTRAARIALAVGHPGETLDRKKYFNITSTDHACSVDKVLNNEVKHCFFGE